MRAKDFIDSMSGKNKDLEKRFGVPGMKTSKMDGGTWHEDENNRKYKERMIEGARNDYDLRRMMEAAAMSGKKKANKLIDKGFKSVDDVRKWQNFSEKAAERHGHGGDFSSATDFMNLSHAMVKRDRRIHDQKIDKRMENMMEDMEGEGEAALPEYQIDNPIGQRGGRENNTSATWDDYQDAYKIAGIANDVFSTGGEGQAATEQSVGSGPAGAAAQLKEFQEKVKTGMALAGVQTRGDGAGVIPGDGF